MKPATVKGAGGKGEALRYLFPMFDLLIAGHSAPMQATGPPMQAMGPPWSDAGVGIGMLRGAGDSLT